METNLEKAKRLLQAHSQLSGFNLPENCYVFQMLELAATPNESATKLKEAAPNYTKADFKCPDCGADLKYDDGKLKFVKHNT